jgi:hypothetical protein
MISCGPRRLRILIILTFFIICSISGFLLVRNKIKGSLVGPASAQNLSAEDFFQQGKTSLENFSLAVATAKFQQALNLDPTHQGANLFYGLTRILMISKSDAFNILLDRAGVSSSGRDFLEGKLTGEADFQRDARGNVILPPNSPTSGELQAFLKNNVAPEIDGALNNLSLVSGDYQIFFKWTVENGSSGLVNSPNTLTDNSKDWVPNEWAGYKIIVQGTEYTIDSNTSNMIMVTSNPNWVIPSGPYDYIIFENIDVDYGDVLALKGFAYSAKAAILILSSYNIDVDIDTLVSLGNAHTLNLQKDLIDKYQQLLTLLPDQQLSQAKDAINKAIAAFLSAIDTITAEGDDQNDDLFIIPSADVADRYRSFLSDLSDALLGTAYIGEWDSNVNLSEFFDSPKELRTYLPTFQGQGFIQRDTFPDPTFGGILPDMMFCPSWKWSVPPYNKVENTEGTP